MTVSFRIIGRHIRAARKSRKFTQEQIAEKLKMTVAHYGRLERGERSINLERLGQISLLLNVPIEQLVIGCVPEVQMLCAEHSQNNSFLDQMSQYTKYCSEETLNRMQRVCSVLASEDTEKE